MANVVDIVVPDLGDFSKVEVIEILVAPGDDVVLEDGLITLETDKAALDVPATSNGVVEAISAGYIDPYVGGGTKDFTPYVLMILVLMVRPYGIFGKPIIERI